MPVSTQAAEEILAKVYDRNGVEVPPEPAPEREDEAEHDDPFARFVPGGTFILDVPDTTPAVWGRDKEVLWAEGEALMIFGPNGVGKTTLCGQVIAGRLGILDNVLGYPVTPGEGRVLYLAMDRPAQAARALRRLFTAETRQILDERLVVWQGPPPKDLAQNTTLMAQMCAHVGADTVVVDSLKDAALKLSEDETGAGYNRARQRTITEGVEVLELHHPRKSGADGPGAQTLDAVYGSAWLTAGAGSVIGLAGAAGDPLVRFTHLKQPSEEVGPFQILHDHDAGTSAVYQGGDLLALMRANPYGLTAKQAAVEVHDTEQPTQAQVEKIRRRLEKLANDGLLIRDASRSEAGDRRPVNYQPAARQGEGA